jgi:drug/metabolite transporter (DMT)-like permease
MSGLTLLVVLFAAVLHAAWNAMVKGSSDKLLSTVMVTTGSGLIAAPLLLFTGLPPPASWIWLGASTCCQMAYFLLLAQAYQHGEMSQAYPLMRGTAPLLVAAASAPLLGDVLSAAQYAAIALIAGGVLAMAISSSSSRRSTLYALANSVMIACYTVIDGIGVRASGAPLAYTLCLFALTAVAMLLAVLPQRARLLPYFRSHWNIGLLGGACTMASYGLALWAMTRAPVAAVAALRETSILFATLIAVFILRERVSSQRLAAVAMIGAGAVAMRLAH